MVSQVYTYFQDHEVVYIRYLQLFVYQLYCNNVLKKQSVSHSQKKKREKRKEKKKREGEKGRGGGVRKSSKMLPVLPESCVCPFWSPGPRGNPSPGL